MSPTTKPPPPQALTYGPIPATPPAQLFTTATLRRAWLAVKRTGGGAGVDGMTIQKFEADLEAELTQLRQQLISGDYMPRPIRRILVPKPNGGLRPLALWALRDRLAQRVIYDIIAPSFEAIFLPCSMGFRPGLGVQDAIRRVQALRNKNRRWVVDADIKDCFDSINPTRLLALVAHQVADPLLLRYIERWLAADIFNTADGIPKKPGRARAASSLRSWPISICTRSIWPCLPRNGRWCVMPMIWWSVVAAKVRRNMGWSLSTMRCANGVCSSMSRKPASSILARALPGWAISSCATSVIRFR